MIKNPYLVGIHTVRFINYFDKDGKELYLDRYYIGDKITGEVEGFDNIDDLNQFGDYDSEYHNKLLLKSKLSGLYNPDEEINLFRLTLENDKDFNLSKGVFKAAYANMQVTLRQFSCEYSVKSCYISADVIAKGERIIIRLVPAVKAVHDRRSDVFYFNSYDSGMARVYLEYEVISEVRRYSDRGMVNKAYKELLKYEPNFINIVLDRICRQMIPSISLNRSDYIISILPISA